MDRLSVLRALAAAGALLFAPGAALAGDEFEDGFKDELGRLAAHEAVRVGRGVLAEVLVGGGPAYYVQEYPIYGRSYYYDDDCDHGYAYPRYGGWYYAPRPYYQPYWGRPHWGWHGGHGHHDGHGWGHRGGYGRGDGYGYGNRGGGGGRGHHGHHR